MYLFTHKLQQARERGREIGREIGRAEGRAEGLKLVIEHAREQGRAEILRLWHADWEQRRQEAAAKGEPFNEPPPPPMPQNGTGV